MAGEINQKSLLRALVLGVAVLGLTPVVASLFSGVALLSTKLLGELTLGGVLAAGIVAFVADLAVEKWM